MLKRLFLLWLFSGSLDSFSQAEETINTSGTPTYSRGAAWKQPSTPDTIHAELLVTYTTRRWGVAHARDGYVVRKDGKVIRFLDDRKRRFPPNTRLWGWISNDEKVRP